MCAPDVIESVRERISRRTFLNSCGVAGAAAAASCSTETSSPTDTPTSSLPEKVEFRRVVDLTHTLHKNFPAWFVEGQEVTRSENRTFIAPSIVEVDPVFEWDSERINMNRVSYWEHVGTHMDAPLHFSEEGCSADDIPVEDLVLPLAVIDIKPRAAEDPLARMTLEDLHSWEAKHGEIPQRALVAMNSGWAHHVETPKFKSLDQNGNRRQPAMHIEAIEFLMKERNVIALGVDTFSFDNQHSPELDVHYNWLGDGRWGLEVLNNLDDVPAVGATIVVGQPKIQGSSGGPDRILALI